MRFPELLAPAGDKECLLTAIRYGADAVYIGGPLLQLRAESAGFSREGVADAVQTAHGAGKRLYVTVNCFARNNEIEAAADYARFLSEVKADAVIVSDLGVLSAMKRAAPSLAVHISTQANCINYECARQYYALGASRIVLGREMTIEEIAQLRAKTPPELELECFVHGAMCMAYSGRCLISSFLTGRSGNRGECTQPCRWEYTLLEQKRPNEFFEVVEEAGHTAILSAHDLNAAAFLKELLAAGISSFKIEGRMKTPYYAAGVTNAYRMAMDGTASAVDIESELNAVSHRPYSTGFYFGEIQKNTFNDGQYHSDCVFAGVALSDAESGALEVQQRNHFAVGDTLEVLSPGKTGRGFVLQTIIDENGMSVQSAPHPKQTVTISCPINAEKGDILRRRKPEVDS